MAEPTDVSTATGVACRYRLSGSAGLSGTSTSDAAIIYPAPCTALHGKKRYPLTAGCLLSETLKTSSGAARTTCTCAHLAL